MAPLPPLPPESFSSRISHSSPALFFGHTLRSIPSLEPRASSTPTKTIAVRTLQPLTRSISALLRRQTILPIPATYSGLEDGPPAGVVVGITLGSVGGFLLVLWLLYSCFNQGGNNRTVVEEEVVRRRSRSPPRRSRSRSETIEIRSPPRREPPRRETVVITETRRPAEREDDIVEVIEEESPPPRRSSRTERVSGGYRTVDPDAYGGGSRPMRKVSRRG